MKCADYKKLIYLYDVLPTPDRQNVDGHLNNCIQCRRLFERVSSEKQFVHRVISGSPLRGKNITDRIMEAIASDEQKQGIGRFEWIVELIASPPVKYALVAASVVFVLFFAVELTINENEERTISSRHEVRETKTTRLNSNAYYETLKAVATSESSAQRQTTVSLYNCIKACDVNGRNTNCTDCKMKYRKF